MYMGNGEPRVYVHADAIKGASICSDTKEDGPVSNAASGVGSTAGVMIAALASWAAFFA